MTTTTANLSGKCLELYDKALDLSREIEKLRHQIPGARAFMLCHAEERQRGVVIVEEDDDE